MFHFLFPADCLEPQKVEEHFRPQADALCTRGHTISLVNDSAFHSGTALRGIPINTTVVYRGWMVRLPEYARLEAAVNECDATLLTNASTYALTHHLPLWYPQLQEFTAETHFITSAEQLLPQLQALNWSGYFLKDFVKSLKVDGGSIVRTPAEATRWLEQMLQYRDELEGGICIRRVESFETDTECRYFVLQGTPHAPDNRPIPDPVQMAAQRIRSPFFTVDVAYTTEGQCRIVELGDGQVSDLVGWSAERFANLWQH